MIPEDMYNTAYNQLLSKARTMYTHSTSDARIMAVSKYYGALEMFALITNQNADVLDNRIQIEAS